MNTNFATVYNYFLNQITDDMYMELTPNDTIKDLQNLLILAIPEFEFPRKNLYDYTIEVNEISKNDIDKDEKGFIVMSTDEVVVVDKSSFNIELTQEEIYIISLLMVCGWLNRQIASIENVRMKYSGTDFKFTSQANHLSKLLTLKDECRRKAFHAQRLYKRRKLDENGQYVSTWSLFGNNEN